MRTLPGLSASLPLNSENRSATHSNSSHRALRNVRSTSALGCSVATWSRRRTTGSAIPVPVPAPDTKIRCRFAGIEKGAREFDFGRSPLESGTYKFKKGWGAIERPLAWVRLESTGSFVSMGGVDANGALKKFSEDWTRLPLGLTGWLGPRIRRFISN